jgi:hypothetical protein
MALYASDAAQYRYFTTDLLTNEVLAEIPFKGVSFERSIKAAGNFSGNIPVIPETAGMNLYESTMPGKTGLYIVRDQVCVWGGIIWNRAYNVVERELSVNANEFTSYFYHRNIWKTYTHDFGVDLTVSGGTVTGVLQTMNYSFPVGSSVRLVFPTTNMYEYNGYYTIATAPNPDQFTITGTSIPNGTYPDVTVYVRVDTYDYVRQLIDAVLEDFAGTTFPNTDIEPAQTERVVIYSKSITDNIATIVTATAHGIIPTQTVELYNVDSTLDGMWDVISTPTSTSFTFAVTASNVSTTLTPTVTKTVNKKAITDFLGTVTTSASHGFTAGDIVEMTGVDGVTATVTNKQLTSNIATLTTSSAHGGNIGDMVTVTNVDATFNGVYYIDDVPTTTTFTYGKTAADVPSAAVASYYVYH